MLLPFMFYMKLAHPHCVLAPLPWVVTQLLITVLYIIGHLLCVSNCYEFYKRYVIESS